MDRYIGLDAHASSCALGVLRAGWKATGGARGGNEREGAHRGAPQHSGISASVPGGRHAGELVVRGTLAACGGACSDGGERERDSSPLSSDGTWSKLRKPSSAGTGAAYTVCCTSVPARRVMPRVRDAFIGLRNAYLPSFSVANSMSSQTVTRCSVSGPTGPPGSTTFRHLVEAFRVLSGIRTTSSTKWVAGVVCGESRGHRKAQQRRSPRQQARPAPDAYSPPPRSSTACPHSLNVSNLNTIPIAHSRSVQQIVSGMLRAPGPGGYHASIVLVHAPNTQRPAA